MVEVVYFAMKAALYSTEQDNVCVTHDEESGAPVLHVTWIQHHDLNERDLSIEAVYLTSTE